VHNHIFQRTYLPEECPACKTFWDSMPESTDYLNKEDELNTARRLGRVVGATYLTDLRHIFLTYKWQLMGLS